MQVPAWLQEVGTPLVRQEWAKALAGHPDREFASYILQGIERGFSIGFDHTQNRCRPAMSNMLSATEQAEVVQAYLDKEVALGRVVGPVSPQSAPANTQISPFGVILKSSQPGKWRLILDLSSPEGYSVNSGIEPELCSLQYLRMDDVVRRIASLGRETRLAKMDIESAYRIVPVQPGDRPLLGMRWKGEFYFDTRLPFGLRSAPKIFSAVADALQWAFQRRGVSWVAHYLDDFITMGAPGSQECRRNLDQMLSTCQHLGVPVASEKCAGPSLVMVFLGFELDTTSMVVRLPQEKLSRIARLVVEWSGRKACKKRDLESLVGHLQHAATVVRPGRTFVRRLIELLAAVKSRDHWIRLNACTRSDLTWWRLFIGEWNGISLLPKLSVAPVVLETDASGSWGCGARVGCRWLQWAWDATSAGWPISPKELLPILMAVAVWGSEWEGLEVECRCDNMAVVTVVNSGHSRDTTLMHLLRCLFFLAAHHHVRIHAVHIPGVSNVATDALSRNDFPRFLQVVPEAAAHPSRVPKQLVDLLVKEQPDLTSLRWAQLFGDCCRRV